jgi:cytoskeleton protein RodZ
MTDETNQQRGEEQADEANKTEGPLAGERLAAARREQQITVLEVAKELHLDEPKVRALEQNKFDVLGAPVFAKGHLRKYAMLVGVDNDDVLQDYYKLNRASGMPPVVGKVRKPASQASPGPWIATIIIVVIAAAAYWWFLVADTPPPIMQDDTVIVPPVDDAMTPANDGAVPAEPVALPEAGPRMTDQAVFDAPAEQTMRPAVTTQPVADGQVRLTMMFSGDCWTEISDASGRRLFFDLGRVGRSVNVSGEAPLSVLFGNADNVRMRVNGMDYSISPADRRGETARLSIH